MSSIWHPSPTHKEITFRLDLITFAMISSRGKLQRVDYTREQDKIPLRPKPPSCQSPPPVKSPLRPKPRTTCNLTRSTGGKLFSAVVFGRRGIFVGEEFWPEGGFCWRGFLAGGGFLLEGVFGRRGVFAKGRF